MPAQQVGIAGAEECRWLRLAQDRLIGQRGQLRHDLACRRRLGQHRQRWNLAHEDTVVLCALPVDHARERIRHPPPSGPGQWWYPPGPRRGDIAPAEDRGIDEAVDEIDDTQSWAAADPDRSAESLGAVDVEIVPAHPMPLKRSIEFPRRAACC